MNMDSEFYKLGVPDNAPNPRPGFETDLISEVVGLVAELPADTARLTVSRFPGHPEFTEPYFTVIPTNPKAAVFKGVAVITDLNLTIGEAAWREFVGFARGGTFLEGLTWQEELRRIWLAVIEGGFTEYIYRDSTGKAIGWRTKLIVDGEELVIRNGRKTERLFGGQKLDAVTYESYFRQ